MKVVELLFVFVVFVGFGLFPEEIPSLVIQSHKLK